MGFTLRSEVRNVIFPPYIIIHFLSLITNVDGFCSWFYKTATVSTQQKDNTTRLVIYKYQNHELIQMATNIPVDAKKKKKKIYS